MLHPHENPPDPLLQLPAPLAMRTIDVELRRQQARVLVGRRENKGALDTLRAAGDPHFVARV